MYLGMNSTDTWEIAGGQDSIKFLDALKFICNPGDRIVFGTDDISTEAKMTLESLGAKMPAPPKDICLNISCYETNSGKWPRAQAFEVIFSEQIIERLKQLCTVSNAGGEKDIFYDDFAAYRVHPAPIPLVDFNHATSGGGLCILSIEIPLEHVVKFADCFGMTARKVKYPPNWR